GGGRKVVIDCLGDSHHGNAMLVKLLGDGERTVTANTDQPVDAKLLNRLLHAIDQVLSDFDAVLDPFDGDEPPLVGGTEYGPTLVENPLGALGGELHVLHGIVKPLVPLEESDALEADLLAALDRPS